MSMRGCMCARTHTFTYLAYAGKLETEELMRMKDVKQWVSSAYEKVMIEQ